MPVRVNWTTTLATAQEGHRGVSRGYASRRKRWRRANLLLQEADGRTRWMRSDQGTLYQLTLFEGTEDDVRHGAGGEGRTGSATYKEPQRPTPLDRERAVASDYVALQQ